MLEMKAREGHLSLLFPFSSPCRLAPLFFSLPCQSFFTLTTVPSPFLISFLPLCIPSFLSRSAISFPHPSNFPHPSTPPPSLTQSRHSPPLLSLTPLFSPTVQRHGPKHLQRLEQVCVPGVHDHAAHHVAQHAHCHDGKHLQHRH